MALVFKHFWYSYAVLQHNEFWRQNCCPGFIPTGNSIHSYVKCICEVGLPLWLSGKESTYSAEDLGLIPGSGRSCGEENGNPLQYSWLGTKSWTQLSDNTGKIGEVFFNKVEHHLKVVAVGKGKIYCFVKICLLLLYLHVCECTLGVNSFLSVSHLGASVSHLGVFKRIMQPYQARLLSSMQLLT